MALLPDAATVEALARASLLMPLPKRVPSEMLHLTLRWMGPIEAEQAEDLHHELARIHLPGFPLCLRGFGLFGQARPDVLWAGLLPSEPLDLLQSAVMRAARQAGIALPHQRFIPHVTLGRFTRIAPDAAMRLERAVAEGSDFAPPPWQVSGFSLMESRGEGAALHYHELAAYPLSAAPREDAPGLA